MVQTLLKSKYTYWVLFLYLVCVVWWGYLKVNNLSNTNESYLFNWFYGFIALSGAGYGVYISHTRWGGWDSVIGKGLILLSLGLFGQWFGLQVWTYYNVIAHLEVPYPSWADLGYFSLVPFYGLSAFMFAKASGAKFSLKTKSGKVWAAVIPFMALMLSYSLFLRDIGLDLSDPLKTFLDFGYPLGEIIPVSIAMFTLTLSRSFLGGTMRSRIIYLVGAFFFQFLTEYAFLYAAGAGLYTNGGWNDLMYASAYTIMSLGLISFSDDG